MSKWWRQALAGNAQTRARSVGRSVGRWSAMRVHGVVYLWRIIGRECPVHVPLNHEAPPLRQDLALPPVDRTCLSDVPCVRRRRRAPSSWPGVGGRVAASPGTVKADLAPGVRTTLPLPATCRTGPTPTSPGSLHTVHSITHSLYVHNHDFNFDFNCVLIYIFIMLKV